MATNAAAWTPPAALLMDRNHLEAATVLDEVDGPLGASLWQWARDVTLWATTPATDRWQLFASQATPPRITEPGLTGPAARFADMLAHPGYANAEDLAEACATVSSWAERKSRTGTALAFAQAAALCTPQHAARCYRVGVLATKRTEWARAEGWMRRAVGVARSSRDWHHCTLAWRGMGVIYTHRGKSALAGRHLERALHVAQTHRARRARAQVAHDLCVHYLHAGAYQLAEKMGTMAAQLYGPKHEAMPRLANDLAYLWMERGEFARAVPVLSMLAMRVKCNEERLAVWANLARAAGGAGLRALFDDAWAVVWGAREAGGADNVLAGCLLDLARGAAMLGDLERATQAADEASARAGERGQWRAYWAAEAVAQAARTPERTAPDPIPEPCETGALLLGALAS